MTDNPALPSPPAVVPIELPAGPVLLRPWRVDDLDALWEALQDTDIRRWNGTGATSRADAARMLDARRDWSGGDHASWAMADPGTRALLGSVSLHAIDLGQANAEIGYWTAPFARGRGYATAGVAAVCRWAFDVLNLERIELRHAVANPASGRVAGKAGFTLEGRLRRSYRYGDGVLHDELLWSRLRDDEPAHFRPAR